MLRHIRSPSAAVAAATTVLLLAIALPRVSGAGLAANNTKSILYIKSTLNVRTGCTSVLHAACLLTGISQHAPAFCNLRWSDVLVLTISCPHADGANSCVGSPGEQEVQRCAQACTGSMPPVLVTSCMHHACVVIRTPFWALQWANNNSYTPVVRSALAGIDVIMSTA